MRIRANSAFAKLTPDQCEQIFEWIASGTTYRDVKERCAQPPPVGFDFHVSLDALWNFYKAERHHRHAEQLAQVRYENCASDDPEQLFHNMKIELAHACYELTSAPGSPIVVNSLSRIAHRADAIKLEQQRIAIDQQRLTLEREFLAEKKRQFNFNAAREAAKHAAKIHKVIETRGPDNEDKIWMVNNIVFGPPPQIENPPPTQTE
jgi:hypothetical protein